MSPKRRPPPPRSTTPLLVVLGFVVLAAAGVGFWLGTAPSPSSNGGTNASADSSVPGPTLPADPEGTVLSESTTVGGVEVTLLSTFRATEYRGRTAPSGSEFIVVTFTPVPGSGLATAADAGGARLRTGGKEYVPVAVVVPSVQDAQVNGAVAFTVPTGGTNFQLELGTATLRLPNPTP